MRRVKRRAERLRIGDARRTPSCEDRARSSHRAPAGAARGRGLLLLSLSIDTGDPTEARAYIQREAKTNRNHGRKGPRGAKVAPQAPSMIVSHLAAKKGPLTQQLFAVRGSGIR